MLGTSAPLVSRLFGRRARCRSPTTRWSTASSASCWRCSPASARCCAGAATRPSASGPAGGAAHPGAGHAHRRAGGRGTRRAGPGAAGQRRVRAGEQRHAGAAGAAARAGVRRRLRLAPRRRSVPRRRGRTASSAPDAGRAAAGAAALAPRLPVRVPRPAGGAQRPRARGDRGERRGRAFEARTPIWYSEYNRGVMREPHVERFWGGDLYISPVEVLSGDGRSRGGAREGGEPRLRGRPRDLRGFAMRRTAEEIRVVADVEVERPGGRQLVQPAVVSAPPGAARFRPCWPAASRSASPRWTPAASGPRWP